AERDAVQLFAREIAPAGTGLVPGLTGFFGGRPAAIPVVTVTSYLVDKSAVEVRVERSGSEAPVALATGGGFDPQALPPIEPEGAERLTPSGETARVPLGLLAWGRSGDKGDHANIGVMARRPEFVPLLRAILSEEVVAGYFAHILRGDVVRYELPGLNAFNFVLHHVLGGGGTASLRMDPQGKAFAQMLLDLPMEVPAEWVDRYGWREEVVDAA
ncbi:MAG: terpene utilization protein AtuA, partial [SAR324 cluster bacterium]|nr:terpene utilization protein AtuA [SAR324 cluster bacterium]